MEPDPIQVAEILCCVGLAPMIGGPEIDAMIVVEQIEERGSEIGAQIMQVDIQICVIFVTAERHLLACAAHCI